MEEATKFEKFKRIYLREKPRKEKKIKILSLSLQTGSFPDTWKHADVRPRLKKSKSEAIFAKLRSISNLLPFASKLTERAVFLQMHDYLSTYNHYPLAQSAYRQHHSTETALLKVKNDILLNMKQRVTLLLRLDLSAAFNTVDHTILLDRLHTEFGMSGQALLV